MKNIFNNDKKLSHLKWTISRKNYNKLKKMNLTSCRCRVFISLNFLMILVLLHPVSGTVAKFTFIWIIPMDKGDTIALHGKK